MEVKKRLRDLNRLLSHKETNPEQKREIERKIRGLVHQMEEKTRELRTENLFKKYKMVRFFERQKAERKLKKNPEDEDVRVDLVYIRYYPRWLKYLSLYKINEDDKVTLQRRSELYQVMRNYLKQNEVDDSSSSIKYESVEHFIMNQLEWAHQALWKMVINPNKKIYAMLDMNIEDVMKERMALLTEPVLMDEERKRIREPETVAAEANGDEDDFFNPQPMPETSASKQALQQLKKRKIS